MTPNVHISLMLAVQDAPAAVDWYKRALGATELWNLGGVAGLSIEGAPVFVGEPENNGWDAPAVAGTRTVRVEVFTDDPDGFIERATVSWLADRCQRPADRISADSPTAGGMGSDLIYLTRNEPHPTGQAIICADIKPSPREWTLFWDLIDDGLQRADGRNHRIARQHELAELGAAVQIRFRDLELEWRAARQRLAPQDLVIPQERRTIRVRIPSRRGILSEVKGDVNHVH